jgi:hypothetical protein
MSMQLISNICTVQVCSMKTTAVKIGFDARKPKVGTRSLCEISDTGLCVCVCVFVCVCVWRAYEMTGSYVLWPLNVTKTLIL